MSTAAAIRTMLAAGLSVEQALVAVEAMEAAGKEEKPRSAAALRQARYRERKAGEASRVTSQASRNVTSVTTVTNDVTPSSDADEPRARVLYCEDINIYTPCNNPSDYSSPKPTSPTRKAKKPTIAGEVIAALTSAGLSDGTSRDLLEHRKAKGAPLTRRAAELLGSKLSAYPAGPEAAAAMMIERGWQGFDPQWAESRAGPGARNGVSASSDFRPPHKQFAKPTLSLDEARARAERFHELEKQGLI